MTSSSAQQFRIPAGPHLTGAFAVASVAVLLALAACAQNFGSNGNQGEPAGPDTGVVSSGPLPSSSSTAGSPTPNVVSPEPAVDLHRERWVSVKAVGGREVLVHGSLTGGPPCAVVGRVEVAESQKRVTITLWVGRRQGAPCDGPQPEVAFPFVTRVTLAAPLGEREVRDGAA